MSAPSTVRAICTTRPATPADDGFLAALFASTRGDLLQAGLAPGEHAALLELQWHAQQAGYRDEHPGAVDEIVELYGGRVGRLLVDWEEEQVTVVDVALLPAWRGEGICTALLEDVKRGAAERGLPVVLHVASGNPARRLYERLGFTEVAEIGVYTEMSWCR